MKWQSKNLRFWWAGMISLACLILLVARDDSRAASASETKAYTAAAKLVQNASGPTMWAAAEERFADFIKNHPNSEHYADAVVFEARAMFEQGKYAAAIDLLISQEARADKAADQFTYWIARAQTQLKNYQAASETYARLVRDNTNSPLRLEAVFREADANAKLERWPRVIEELQDTNGVFQQMATTNRSDDLVVRGLLLLGEAQLVQKNYDAAEKILGDVQIAASHPELEWNRQSLICRAQLGAGKPEAALRTSTNLLAVAGLNAELRAKSVILQGQIFERLDQFSAAIQIYQTNLNAELPVALQRQALLRIVELTLRQKKTEEAAKLLSDFFAKHPDEAGADFELLMYGELQLKQHFEPPADGLPGPPDTNFLKSAEADFAKLIKTYTNSPYLGKAELNLGWCLWTEGRIAESQMAFSNALAHLPFSEDQAVARFKLGDIFYQNGDFTGALANYSAITNEYASLPGVKRDLFEQTLYQIVRTSLQLTNLAIASEAMTKILAWFPDGELADNCLLLVGQAQKPLQAREIFSTFEAKYPKSELLPEMKLAVARTYEAETNFVQAIADYDAWVKIYTNSPVLPRAEFLRAWAYSEAGEQSNAFVMFTNFVSRFQTNEFARTNDLPAKAQYWVGDYYWGEQDYQKAELSYKEIFTKWPDSGRAFQARMMAGRSAIASQRPQDAIADFTYLAGNTNTPPELAAQASFASGDATLALPLETNTNKYSDAIAIFRSVATHYTNSPMTSLAWCRYADCYFALPANEMSQYETASNTFEKVMVMEPALADITTRSMAEFRLAQTLQAMAALQPVADQKPLLKSALEHYFNVFSASNLQDKEVPDPHWTKEAGLEAAKLAEQMGEWRQAIQFYETLRKMAPPLENVLEKRIAKAQDNLALEKK